MHQPPRLILWRRPQGRLARIKTIPQNVNLAGMARVLRAQPLRHGVIGHQHGGGMTKNQLLQRPVIRLRPDPVPEGIPGQGIPEVRDPRRAGPPVEDQPRQMRGQRRIARQHGLRRLNAVRLQGVAERRRQPRQLLVIRRNPVQQPDQRPGQPPAAARIFRFQIGGLIRALRPRRPARRHAALHAVPRQVSRPPSRPRRA